MSSIVIAGDTSGSVTLQAPATAGTTVLTLPATSGTVITSASGTAATATNLAGGSNGTIPYQSAAGTTQMLAVGTAGQLLQTNGAGAPTWTTIASGLSAATQAQMEAASSNTVAATPLNTNWHPGVAKAWINGSVTGTINSSWNIASITDDGVGECTIFIATDFSSVNYVVAIGITSGSTKSVITPNLSVAHFTGLCTTFANVSSDPDQWLFVCYGDQA